MNKIYESPAISDLYVYLFNIITAAATLQSKKKERKRKKNVLGFFNNIVLYLAEVEMCQMTFSTSPKCIILCTFLFLNRH